MSLRRESHENTPKDYRHARGLRNNASPVENKLWAVLREAAKTVGLKFRRQQAIHPYIADFACMEARLLIEVDGDSHAESTAYDMKRDAKLRQDGFTVLRVTNNDVVTNADGVATFIIEQAAGLISDNKMLGLRDTPLPDPPREGEGNVLDPKFQENTKNA